MDKNSGGYKIMNSDNFDNFDVDRWPFFGENRHFWVIFALNYPTPKGSKIQKKPFSQKVSLSPWIFEKTPKNDPQQVVAPVECHYRFFQNFPNLGEFRKF